MLSCDTCDHLKETIVVVNHNGGMRYRCGKIPVGDLLSPVTTHDEDGEHPYLIINNPYKFGCLLHSKLEDYYKRITRDDLIPNDDVRIRVR